MARNNKFQNAKSKINNKWNKKKQHNVDFKNKIYLSEKVIEYNNNGMRKVEKIENKNK